MMDNKKIKKNKKRQRKDSSDESDDMDVDDNIVIDEAWTNKKDLDSSDQDIDMNGMINIDFVFSGLKENYFHNMKTLIKPLFEFDNINISDLSDMILQQREDIGTVIKSEDEEETKNTNIEVFAIFSLLPLTFYANGDGSLQDKASTQLFNCFQEKINKYISSNQEKNHALDILKGKKIALLISERFINLPQQAVPHSLKFTINEVEECRDQDGYDGRYEFDYVIFMTKFVKKTTPNFKNVKKSKTENFNDEILHYKFETEHYWKKAEVNITYKVPYEQNNLEHLENKNEPQFYSILFIKWKDFVDIVNYLEENNN